MIPAAELALMSAVIVSSFDVTITVQRKSITADTYGHSIEQWNASSTPKVNIVQPTASQLQTYADVIGSQWALMLRFATTSDIREGDRVVYNGHNWLVQNILNAESYSFSNTALITVIA